MRNIGFLSFLSPIKKRQPNEAKTVQIGTILTPFQGGRSYILGMTILSWGVCVSACNYYILVFRNCISK